MCKERQKGKTASTQQHDDNPCSCRYDLYLNVNELTAIVEEMEKLKTVEEAGRKVCCGVLVCISL